MKLAKTPQRIPTTLRLSPVSRRRLERLHFELRLPMQDIVEEALAHYEHQPPSNQSTDTFLFDPRFMASGLRKQHLRRADYYNA